MIATAAHGWTLASRGLVAAIMTAGLALPASRVTAQEPPAATMTLEEAIRLARQNNPTYRQAANDESLADWNVRQAYGSFLPSLSLSSSMTYSAPGTPRIGIFSSAELGISRLPANYSSSYTIGMGLNLSGSTIFGAVEAKASQNATEKRVAAAAYQMSTDVTRQYLLALRAQDGVAIAASALESSEEARRLAAARAAAGDATRIDASQAEVDHGRNEVLLLQAENLARTERLRLLSTIGIELSQDVDLTTPFEVFEPRYDIEQLQAIAGTSNPVLAAARADEAAANAASRAAKTAYLPSLNINAGWSGTIRRTGTDQYQLDRALGTAQSIAEGDIEECQFFNQLSARLTSPLPDYPVADCTAEYALTPTREAEIRQAVSAEYSRFPFDYDPNPFFASIQVSLPIVDGFTRERNVHQAKVQAEDAEHRRRGEELNRRAEVTTNHLALETAWRTVELEERNVANATEQLQLAQERYRLGAGSILELAQAQETKIRADFAQLDAVYTFHETLAALEAAVGIPLREMTNAAGELEYSEPRER